MAELHAIDPIPALFQGELSGVVCLCYENERPLQGLIAEIDWKLLGFISKQIERKHFTGKPGECIYLPVTHMARTLHVVVVGAGHAANWGDRKGKLAEGDFKALIENLKHLKIEKIGVSQKEFAAYSVSDLLKRFEKTSTWITH